MTLPDQQILVLGMHRSGTSAIARTLELMGAWIGEPGDLLPEHPVDNPTGYWERADILIEHDRFLEQHGYAWDRLAGFDIHEIDDAQRAQFTSRLKRIVSHLDPGGRPWLLKDPRLSLLLPVWNELLDDPALIVAVRDPREIAASMHRSHRGGYATPFLLALWEKYLRSVLVATSGKRALFVSWPRLLADPQGECDRLLAGLQQLGINGLTNASSSELSGFLDRSLHRSRADPGFSLSPAQQELFDWLDQQCTAPQPVSVSGFPDAPAPDALLRDFEEARTHQDKHVSAQALGEVASRLENIENALVHEHKHLTDQLTRQRDRVAASQQHVRNLESQLESVHGELEFAQVELDQRDSHVGNLEVELAHFRDRASDLEIQRGHREETIAALQGSLSWKLTAPLRFVAKIFIVHVPWAIEHAMHKAYYAIPGLTPKRKRATIVWFHEHAAWLTRSTLSYRLYQQERRLADLMHENVPRRMDARRAAEWLASVKDPPLISVVMPVYNVEAKWLKAAIDSVKRQFYPHWQLCIADDASTCEETRELLASIKKEAHPKIKLQCLKQNLGIAGASDAALALATGDYVGLLDHDDELTRDALLEMARCIVDDAPDMLYSDEDKLDEDGNHVEPHFKPDFSQDLLFSNNYICHFTAIRRSLLESIDGFMPGYDGAQDFDLVLRVAEQTDRIVHIPKVLYHWRKIPNSTAADSNAKPETSLAGRKAVADSLKRRELDARVEMGPFPNTFRVQHTIVGSPLISILVPFRDKPELLEQCVGSILERTSYSNYEIVGIDNGSVQSDTLSLMRALESRDTRIRFVRFNAPFNYSAINNFGARHANGEYLLFLNNDTHITDREWLGEMLAHSQRPEVGVVGARLLYADGNIQHAGVVIGLGGVAGHPHIGLPAEHPGYFARAQLTQNVSAVTFACAMTRKSIFEELHGLEDKHLTIAFNDIDYCLRAREAGYQIVYVPASVLYHLESTSRGAEDNPEKLARFHTEVAYMQQRHADALRQGDPYYNPNLSLVTAYEPSSNYVGALPE